MMLNVRSDRSPEGGTHELPDPCSGGRLSLVSEVFRFAAGELALLDLRRDPDPAFDPSTPCLH